MGDFADDAYEMALNGPYNEWAYDYEQNESVLDWDSYDSDQCPKCGKALVERDGKHGKFMGCSTFPECYGTRSIVNQSFWTLRGEPLNVDIEPRDKNTTHYEAWMGDFCPTCKSALIRNPDFCGYECSNDLCKRFLFVSAEAQKAWEDQMFAKAVARSQCDHQCRCACHRTPGMLHIMACCHYCTKCERGIDILSFDHHQRNCH